MNPIKSLLINNAPVSLGSFVVPQMSLSSSRAQMCEYEFVLEASASELFEVLAPAYRAWVVESKQDDEMNGGPQDALAVAGYPTLDELEGNPHLLELVLGSYLLNEFLGKFTWDGTSGGSYWFDRTTGCRAKDGIVSLTGICYSHRRLP
jgi:hypothetical protein